MNIINTKALTYTVVRLVLDVPSTVVESTLINAMHRPTRCFYETAFWRRHLRCEKKTSFDSSMSVIIPLRPVPTDWEAIRSTYSFDTFSTDCCLLYQSSLSPYHVSIAKSASIVKSPVHSTASALSTAFLISSSFASALNRVSVECSHYWYRQVSPSQRRIQHLWYRQASYQCIQSASIRQLPFSVHQTKHQATFFVSASDKFSGNHQTSSLESATIRQVSPESAHLNSLSKHRSTSQQSKLHPTQTRAWLTTPRCHELGGEKVGWERCLSSW
jgi:hypothetical protein